MQEEFKKWADEHLMYGGDRWAAHFGWQTRQAEIDALKEENKRLRLALKDLLNDTQHKDHDCGDEEWCPVIAARKALTGA